MAIEIRTRISWSSGSEVIHEVEAFDGEVRMFSPGATVSRDRRFGKLATTIAWGSSGLGDRSVEVAQAQLKVMARAIELATETEV